MKRSILTTIAFYREDETLFDGFALPEGMKKDELVNRLLLEIGELQVIYTNPLVMKDAIGFWSRTRVEIWEKLYNMMTYEYNPIWNVDGETWHDGTNETHGTQSGTNNRDYTRNRTNQDIFSGKIDEANDTTNYISADNSQAWSNDTKTDYNGETATNNTDTATENITDNDDTTSTGKDDRFGADNWHERRQGNIGVTMTQQLLEAEKELWSSYDIYEYIIADFKQEFAVMVW